MKIDSDRPNREVLKGIDDLIHRMGRRRGFLSLESVLGLLLLTLVSMAAGVIVIKTSHLIVHQRLAKKAAKLGEMVLEFYQDRSIGNFYALGQWDRPTPVPVQTFLGLNYNPGHFQITTQTQCNSQFSNCLVNATLTWKDGQGNHSMSFRKNFAERAPAAPSGTAMVYVGPPPCNGLTDPKEIVRQCGNGFAGILVSAPTQANPRVNAQALTGPDGIAILGGVQLSSAPDVAIPFTAQAPSPPSGFKIPGSDSNFIQGYYRSDSTIAPVNVITTDSLPVPVVSGTQAQIVFTRFLKMGRLHGTVAGLPCGMGSGCAGAEVELAGDAQPVIVADPGAASSQNGYRPCIPGSDACRVAVDSSGHYEFNNVLPLNNVNLSVPGIPGTPTVPTVTRPDGKVYVDTDNGWVVKAIPVPTDSGFVRGYSNTSSVPVVWNGSTTDIQMPLQAFAMGDALIRLSYNGNPQYANPRMAVMYWPKQWWSDTLYGFFIFPQTYGLGGMYGSVTGLLYLSNIVTAKDQCGGLSTAVFYAYIPKDCDTSSDPNCLDAEYRPSFGGPDPANHPDGLYGRVNCTGTMGGGPTNLTIDMTPGVTLTGQFVPASGIQINNMKMSYHQILVKAYNRDEKVNNDGSFALPSWTPVKYGNPPQHETGILMRLSRPATVPSITIQVIGTEATTWKEYSCVQPCSNPANPRLAGEMPFSISEGAQAGNYITGSNGASAIMTVTGCPWRSYQTYPLPPAPANPLAAWDMGPIPIDRLTMLTGSPNNSPGYDCSSLSTGWASDISLSGTNSLYLACSLKGYRIYGYVKDSQGNALNGVLIYDYNISRSQSLDINNNPITTDALGYYSAYFKPRKPDFTVLVSIGTSGQPQSTTYGAINADNSVTLSLPDPLTPVTGLRQDFTLDIQPVFLGGGL